MSTSPPNSNPPPSPLTAWGTSSLPPMALATLITALHARPLQPLPLLFTAPLVLSSYLSVAGFRIDGAGLCASWSGLYALLALRRAQSLRSKFTARGAVRAVAVGLGGVNTVAGGWAYFAGDREKEKVERRREDRWGHGK